MDSLTLRATAWGKAYHTRLSRSYGLTAGGGAPDSMGLLRRPLEEGKIQGQVELPNKGSVVCNSVCTSQRGEACSMLGWAVCPPPPPRVTGAWDRRGQKEPVNRWEGPSMPFARIWLSSVGGKVGSRMGLRREGTTRKGYSGGQEEPS